MLAVKCWRSVFVLRHGAVARIDTRVMVLWKKGVGSSCSCFCRLNIHSSHSSHSLHSFFIAKPRQTVGAALGSERVSSVWPGILWPCMSSALARKWEHVPYGPGRLRRTFFFHQSTYSEGGAKKKKRKRIGRKKAPEFVPDSGWFVVVQKNPLTVHMLHTLQTCLAHVSP